MATILNLALPFFGLVLAGFVAAKIFKLPESGLAWLNILIVYFALPSMIFLTVAAAPFEKLIDWPFVLATTLATYLTFIVPFIFSVFVLRTRITTAAIHGTSASFGNVGYMGLPLAVAFFGTPAAVPAALIFCFDCALQFTLTPLLATLGHSENDRSQGLLRIWGKVATSVITHPFIVATILGVLASAFEYSPPELIDGFLQLMSRAAGPRGVVCARGDAGDAAVGWNWRRISGDRRDENVCASGAGLQPFVADGLGRSVVAQRGIDDGGAADGGQCIHPGVTV